MKHSEKSLAKTLAPLFSNSWTSEEVWKGTYHEKGASLYDEWDCTRKALFEARQRGIHPFCITIDEQAKDYLPHMYGDSNYVVIDDLIKQPYRISEIYRGLTS